MTRMIDWMARNGVASNLLFILIFLVGSISAFAVVQEVFPEFSLDAVQVRVEYPGSTPEEIEESIVQRIEDRIQGVEGIDRVLATASENFGVVTAELQRGADAAQVRDEIKQEVDRITAFPEEAEQPTVTELSNRRQVLQVAIYGRASESALKEAAKQLDRQLTQYPEISLIERSGIRDYEISIELDRQTLRTYGLTLSQVAGLVREGSLDLPGGEIETDSEQILIRTQGQNYTKQDFEDIVLISRDDGTQLRLGDVATVIDGFEDADLITRFNGERAAFLQVFRTGNEQVLRNVEVVQNHLDTEFRPSLPDGIQVGIWQNEAENLQSRLNLLIENGILGLLLVIATLMLFLNPRLAFWTSVGISLAFVGTFGVMYLTGTSINLISLFGFILSIGIVVDDAIVVGENVFAEQEKGADPTDAAVLGTSRVSGPVIFAVLTTVAAFMPLLFIEGILGKFLGDIPFIVIVVLLLSLVEVLFILPYHLSNVKKTPAEDENAFVRRLKRVQQRFADALNRFINGPLKRALQYSTRHYGVALCVGFATLILVGGFIAGGYVRFSFLPSIEGKLVTAQLELPVGTTAAQTQRITDRLETVGRETATDLQADLPDSHPEIVRNVFTSIGQQPQANAGPAEGGTNLIDPRLAEVSFELIDPEERDVSASAFEQAWRERFTQPAGIRSLTFSADVVNLGDPVAVELAAGDAATLDDAVAALQDSLRQFGGVFDVESDQQAGKREVQLALRPEARTLDLTLSDLAQQVRAGFFGAEAYRLQRGEDEVQVFTRLPERERQAITDLESYRIRTPDGAFVPLGDVATADIGFGPSQINRRGGRRVITVTADVNEETVTGQEVNGVLEARVLPAMQGAFAGLDFSFEGEQREQQQAIGSLLVGFAIALFAIYALLAIPFRSYIQPLVIMSVIPFGWAGAIIGHLLLNIPIGLLSIFGFVGLSGVVVNNSLVYIDFANEEFARGKSWGEALVAAGQSRFRPILLTSITTFLGVFPIIIETSVQAQFLVPLAVSLGLGILLTLPVVMLLIPAFAMLQYRITEYLYTQVLDRPMPAMHGSHSPASDAA
ncbi:MAG: efflux RND transporter permease subunit [Bacteroidota bacterium]